MTTMGIFVWDCCKVADAEWNFEQPAEMKIQAKWYQMESPTDRQSVPVVQFLTDQEEGVCDLKNRIRDFD